MKRIAAIFCVLSMSLAAGAQTNHVQTLVQFGQDAVTRGEPKAAMEYFKKAISLKPGDADLHFRLANASMLAGAEAGMFGALPMARKAKVELERTIQLDPDHIRARFTLLEFHVMAPAALGGSDSVAIEQATEIRKRDAIDGHRAFARIHTAAKKRELAQKELIDMVRAHPASARAHYHFAVHLMITEKNYKSASEEFESTLRLDPSYMPAYFQIGHVAALAASRFERGEEALKKYLQYRPKDDEPSIARAYYWLGAVYEKQGRKVEAKRSYAASLKINPNQKDVRAAMKRL